MSEDFWVGVIVGLVAAYVGWFGYAGITLLRDVIALARESREEPTPAPSTASEERAP